jgi:hypothetical protein
MSDWIRARHYRHQRLPINFVTRREQAAGRRAPSGRHDRIADVFSNDSAATGTLRRRRS